MEDGLIQYIPTIHTITLHVYIIVNSHCSSSVDINTQELYSPEIHKQSNNYSLKSKQRLD